MTINMLSRYKPAATPTRHWIGGIAIFLISICLFLWSAVSVQNAFDFIDSTSRANGVVVRQTAGKHHVDVRFNTAKGEVVEYGQNGLISYQAGDKVTVLYYADNPRTHPSTDAFGALWGGAVTLFMVGCFTSILSWLTVFRPHLIHITGFDD
jgi:hypothetical protein